MPSALKTARVFVSSTFKDTHAERDHLVTVVFPELRERLERLGLDFYDVDLRWGVPERDAEGKPVNSWAYCKRSINDVEPFFINILGQRYGQIPSAEEINDDRDRTEFADMSITEMEIRHAVLSRRLSRRSFFYFRKTTVPKKDTPPDIYKEFVDHGKQVYLKKFKKQIQKESGHPVRFYECRWTGKGFSKLDNFGRKVLEDLWSGVLRDNRYVSKDAWRQVLGHEPDADPLYTDDSQPIPQEVWQQIVERAKPAPRDPLDTETEGMAAFAASRLRWFQGRRRELQQLQQFIDSDLPPEASRLCVVKAIAGNGKSALLAKLADMVEDSPHLIISHFVGATERSADTRSLLERLVRELDRNGIPKPTEEDFKEDLDSLKKQLAARLESYDSERRIVLLIDAVNQLTAGYDLTWLPRRLGSNVRIVISCIDDPSSSADSPEARIMTALRDREPEPYWVDVTPLDEEDVREIVERHLLEYSKKLDSRQVEDICHIDQARNPLYLLVMLHALRILPGEGAYRKVPDIIADMSLKYHDTVSLFDWVLDRSEVFGKEPVRLWCIYLSLGRVGMSSHELSDLLARKLGKEGALIAHRIERGIRQYLQRRGRQWDFFHGQLRKAVARRYLPENTSPYHADIAAYLENRWHEANIHVISELPYHQTCGELWNELEAILTDLRFIEAKCAAGMTYDLIADYNLALGTLPEAQEERQNEREHEKRVKKYTEDLIAYARGEIEHLDIIPSVEPWSNEKIRKDTERIINNPTRLDRIQVFSQFVNSESHALVKFISHPGFVLQQAYNSARYGPVANAAEAIVNAGVDSILLLQPLYQRPDYNSHPALLRTLELPTRANTPGVCITPDGKRAASASDDKTLRIWDLESGECLRTLQGHTDWANSVSITPDGKRAVSGSHDKTLRVWDLESGECLRTLEGHTRIVWSVSITPDGKKAISGGYDETLRVWDLERWKCLKTLKGHTDAVRSVSVTPDGKRAFSASGGFPRSRDNSLRVWDVESGECLRALKGHTGSIWSVSVTPDGKRAVSASYDHTVRVWDVESGECIRTLKGDIKEVNSVSITPDGKRAVSASGYIDGKDYNIRLWDLESGECLKTLEGHASVVSSVSITPDGKRAISGSMDHTLRVWDLESGECVKAPNEYGYDVLSVSLTPDGKRTVSGNKDRTLRVWDVESGECLRALKGHTDAVSSVSVTPDGKGAVSRGSKILQVWDLESGECLRTLEGDTGSVRRVGITPDGKRAVSGGRGNTLKVWDLENGECLKTLEGHTYAVLSVSITPDAKRALSASKDKTVRVWDLESGECLRTLEGHTNDVNSVSITPDGKRAVSASYDYTLRVWDLENGECLRTLEGHTHHVLGVSATPDGKRAVSGSEDRTVRVWDLESMECIAVYQAGSEVMSVSEARAGGRFAFATYFGEVILLIPRNFPMEPPIVTPVRIWLYDQRRRWLFVKRANRGRWSDSITATCHWCGQPFPVAYETLDMIADIARDANLSLAQSPCLELPDEAWEEPRLLSECPLCHKTLRFNPFVVDNRREY